MLAKNLQSAKGAIQCGTGLQAGGLSDLDGDVWEIAYNPGFPLAEDGSITIPDFNRA
jgi:uncharacterized protein